MKIVVTSPSFSKHPMLIKDMEAKFDNYVLNTKGSRFNEDELIDYIGDAQAVIVGLDQVSSKVLDACPNLKIVSKYGVGLDNVNISACKERNIAIGWTGGVNKLSVAEMVIGNAISLLRNLYYTSNLLKNGKWQKNGGKQLSETVVGIIGIGHIGKEVIRLLKPFKCTILVNDIIEQNEYYEKNGLTNVSKEEIFKTSDVITIHTPLTDDTKEMINTASLALMKNDAIIINTARGPLINLDDLEMALKTSSIGGASLDVYDVEPPIRSGLIAIPNLINTPHIGGNSKEAVYAMGSSAIEHVCKFFDIK
jgi:D-3-phosphoglycerate dehydrogenase